MPSRRNQAAAVRSDAYLASDSAKVRCTNVHPCRPLGHLPRGGTFTPGARLWFARVRVAARMEVHG
jgi:hypothetical protein